MSEYMAQKADEQIDGGISEREEMWREIQALRAERDRLREQMECVAIYARSAKTSHCIKARYEALRKINEIATAALKPADDTPSA